jgi:hypothetical protein
MYRSKSLVVALCVSILTFFATYYWCYQTFGLVFTYFLGWLPSWIAAYFASVLTRQVWSAAAAACIRTRALVLIALASVISDHS